jgi:pimeloyl-ACP methyl ester carboxylesterase
LHYDEGIRIATTLKDLDGPNVNPQCHTRLYTHGYRTQRALVLLHQFTRCPQELDAVGRQFFDRGWNVLIPRYPRHGYHNQFSDAIAELRADHLIAAANRAALAASGLGEHLAVAGVSLGAVLAGWLAQTRDDVSRAVLIEPRPLPGLVEITVTRIVSRLSNDFVKLKGERYSSHAYAAVFETGRRLMKAAGHEPPKAGGIAVFSAKPCRLVGYWRRNGAGVETYRMPSSAEFLTQAIEG